MLENSIISSNEQALIQAFSGLPDPRVQGRCLYSLVDIIFIAICAILCGAQYWTDIAEFGRQRIDWLRQYLPLKNGIPSHQTFCRIFNLIPAEEMLTCFSNWGSSRITLQPRDIISVDGKTLRKSGHKAIDQKALHLINAYATSHGITLGSIKTPEKSNEIKGIPPLLKSLSIQDCVITLDSMGTQKGIANLIRLKEAHYVLALKKNHKRLYKRVVHLFTQAKENGYQSMVYKETATKAYDHSRFEKREYTVLPSMYLPPMDRADWKDLQTFIEVKSTRNKEEVYRYYICSLPLKEYQVAAKAVREHWQVENKLHWKLDVAMQEDACRIYSPYAAENFSTLRKLVLHLLEKDDSTSRGIAFKQWKASLNSNYLKNLLNL